MYATSRGSFTAFRKRIIERAPTRLNALAIFEPMISITAPMTIEHMTRVTINEGEKEAPRYVIWYVFATTRDKRKDSTKQVEILATVITCPGSEKFCI